MLALLVGGATLMASGGTAAPPAYESARATLALDGRAVARLVRDGDADALFARVSPDLARAVPKDNGRPRAPRHPRDGADRCAYRRVAPSRLTGAADVLLRPRLGNADSRTPGRARRGKRNRRYRRAPRHGCSPRSPRRRSAEDTTLAPLRGEWWVFWGGPTEPQNYHVIVRDQRHAYDFVGWRSGGTRRGSGARNADYWAWGRPVVAPADGVVVAARDGARDNRPQMELENRRNPAGNHVVLDLGNGEFALLAHLQRGSLRVRTGQRVRAGDLLGLCGNSGNSSEPHLHFHVQARAPLFSKARGLPLVFRGYGQMVGGSCTGRPLRDNSCAPRASTGRTPVSLAPWRSQPGSSASAHRSRSSRSGLLTLRNELCTPRTRPASGRCTP